MRSAQYRRWSPPQSPLRIEFLAELLGELEPSPKCTDTSGFLYGVREEEEVRIFSTQALLCDANCGEKIEKLGVFVSRIRGEVFLTESDLGFFEKEQALVALVLAGGKAGFFVRDADGSIQTIQSYEEFPIRGPVSFAAISQQTPAQLTPNPPKWVWTLGGLMALAAVPVAAVAYLLPAFPQFPLRALSLQVSGEQQQMHLSWKPGGNAILEIDDDGERTAVPISPDQSSAIYARRGREVEVSLIPLNGRPGRAESVHFSGPPIPPQAPLPAVIEASSEFEMARSHVDDLRAEAAAKRVRIAALQKAIGRLTRMAR